MSYIARLCLLCGIGADYHLKKTEDLCKKIAKSFVKPNLGHAQCTHLSTAGTSPVFFNGSAWALSGKTFPADHQPAPMLTS